MSVAAWQIHFVHWHSNTHHWTQVVEFFHFWRHICWRQVFAPSSTVAKRALCALWHCYAILLSQLWPSSKGMNIYIWLCFRKLRLLTPDDLQLPWRPLYKLVQQVFHSKYKQLGMRIYSTYVSNTLCTFHKCTWSYIASSHKSTV